MKLMNSLDIAKNDISLAAQSLRNVFAQQHRVVVINNVVKRSHIVAFRSNHFANDQKKRPNRGEEKGEIIEGQVGGLTEWVSSSVMGK